MGNSQYKYLVLFSVITALALPLSADAAKFESGLKTPIDILKTSKTGNELIEKVKRTNVKIVSGDVSRTEFKAMRQIQDPKPRNWDVTVFLSRSKSPIDQAMDLAHELTHAVAERLNPYDPNLKLEEYVAHGIEGDGGEASAIFNECQVGRELLGKVQPASEKNIRERCTSVWTQTVVQQSNAPQLSKAKKADRIPASQSMALKLWRASFYAVGEHFTWVKKVLKEFPVSAKSPQFVSAVARQPYPLALIEEFSSLSRELCSRASQRIAARQGTTLDRVFMQRRCQASSN